MKKLWPPVKTKFKLKETQPSGSKYKKMKPLRFKGLVTVGKMKPLSVKKLKK